jgi:hypothetical protein
MASTRQQDMSMFLKSIDMSPEIGVVRRLINLDR